jgi:hypothetical protein
LHLAPRNVPHVEIGCPSVNLFVTIKARSAEVIQMINQIFSAMGNIAGIGRREKAQKEDTTSGLIYDGRVEDRQTGMEGKFYRLNQQWLIAGQGIEETGVVREEPQEQKEEPVPKASALEKPQVFADENGYMIRM